MRAWLAVIALAGVTGCSGFDRLDFTFKSAPPDSAQVTFQQIRIHEGIALGVTARPMDGSEQLDEDMVVELESKNPAVIGVAPGLPDFDPEEEEDRANWSFVIFGASAGTAVIEVRIDGDVEAQIPATVEAQ